MPEAKADTKVRKKRAAKKEKPIKEVVEEIKAEKAASTPTTIACPSRPEPPDSIVELRKRVETPYPVILVVTYEESRLIETVMEHIVTRVSDEPLEYASHTDVYVWSLTQGLIKMPLDVDPVQAVAEQRYDDEDSLAPDWTLNFIQHEYKVNAGTRRGIFIMRDLHKLWDRPDIGRQIRDMAEALSMQDKVIIVTAPEISIPTELDKTVSVIDFDLPSKSEIDYEVRLSLHSLSDSEAAGNPFDDNTVTDDKSVKLDYTDREIEHIVDACAGLTRFEIWCAMGKCIDPGDGIIDVPTILAEKEQIVAKSGIVEFWRSSETLDDVGGLAVVKEYIEHTKYAFTDAAHAFGVDWPRGMLLLGKPGSAKSLLVKATANHYQIPCLRLDIGKIMAGVVGGSEGNTRRALKTAEAVAPCILWIDEIEKGLSGTGSSNFSDAGTMSRVFGTIMQWMQDRTQPVYVMATANNIDQLPPELLRKGRMDEIFFVDIPVKEEKMEIFGIHLAKRGRDKSRFDLDHLSDVMYTRRGKEYPYSGAEIEAAVQEAIRRAYAQAVKAGITPEINGKGDLDTELLANTLTEIVPLSCTYKERMVKMRAWAMDRARFASKLSEDEVRSQTQGVQTVKNEEGDDFTVDLDVSTTKQPRKPSSAVSRMRRGAKAN